MVQNSKFAVQLLEKVGAPLAAAIEAVPIKGDEPDVDAAKLMAQMLGQAVQVSIALNNSLNVVESEEQADSTRLALAAIAAPLLAGFYRQHERVCNDQDIKRIVKSLEAVLAFAENFTPAVEGASRLSTVGDANPLFDETQISLTVMQAMTPVIEAIFEFPFGQSETKLMQDVSERVQAMAATLAQDGDKLGEMMVLKAVGQVYADCHAAETARLANMGDDNRGELSLDPVWTAFDKKIAMMKVLTGQENAGAETSAAAPVPATVPVAASVSETAAPVAETPIATPAPAQPASDAPPAGPMGFFKPGGNTPPAEVPAAMPAQPASNPVPVPETPVAPVSPPPSAPAEDAPSSPMGFFKPGAKKADEAES